MARFVKLRKWHVSSKGSGTKYLAVRLHAFKKTREVRHDFSVCWVWKRQGGGVRCKDIKLRPKKQKGGVRVDLALRNPLARKSCTLHRTGCCLKYGVRDSSWDADYNNLRGGWKVVNWSKLRWRRGRDPDQRLCATSRTRAS